MSERQRLLAGEDGNLDEILNFQNINEPSQDLIDDLKSSEIVTRSLIPLDNTLPANRTMGTYSTLILFIGRILGSGIFATPGLILRDSQGSYSLYFLCWIIAGLIAYSGLSLYLELGSYIPVNGATKKFLEYLFPWPKYLTTIVFGVFTVLFSLSSSNALVFGEYLRYSLGYDYDEECNKKLALILVIACGVLHASNRQLGIRFQNVLGFIKLVLLAIMMVTCVYVLVIPSSVTKLPNNLSWERFKFPSSSSFSGSVYSTALLKCIHSLGGWTTSHTVQNEIKDPIRTLKKTGPLSIILILVLYLMLNLCYLIVLPYKEMIGNDQLVGALLFTRIYGERLGSLLINLIIAIGSATNVLVVVFADSIMNQEVFKEGFMPFSDILCTNKPFGTPIFGILLHCTVSCLVIFLKKKSIYNYIISIQYYPNQIFHAILCLALLFRLRRRFPNIHAPIRAPTVLIYICLAGSLSVVISPFISGDFKFTLVSLGILGLGFVFWLLKVVLLPALGGYTYFVSPMKQSDGLVYKKWTKLYAPDELHV